MSSKNGPAGQVETLIGHETGREGEVPMLYSVGIPIPKNGMVSLTKPSVDRITYREDYYGDHALGWYDVYVGDQVAASVAARAVAEIQYKESTDEQQG